MPSKMRLSLIIMLVIGLGGAWGYWNIRPATFIDETSTPSVPDDHIDFFVKNARTLQFQEDGLLQYELSAESLEHYQNTDITEVTAPYMQLHRGAQQPWLIHSQQAQVGPKGKEVELIDDVRIERIDAKGRPLKLHTSRLSLFPDKDYAQTLQPVRIEAAHGVTTADGMKAYLNDGKMNLLSNVRGQYEAR